MPDTQVVVRAVPFQLTTELDANPTPLTVRVKPAPAGVARLGERPPMAAPPTMVKGSALEVFEPRVTPMVAGPGAKRFAAGTDAVSDVALRTNVLTGVPFHVTKAPEAKP